MASEEFDFWGWWNDPKNIDFNIALAITKGNLCPLPKYTKKQIQNLEDARWVLRTSMLEADFYDDRCHWWQI